MTVLDPDPRTRDHGCGIRVRWCGRDGLQPAGDGAPPTGAVRWVDVDLDCDAAQVQAALNGLGIDVTTQQVADLVERDHTPVMLESGGVRNVSLVGLVVAAGEPATVSFETVEVLAGTGWLVTCWQHSRVCDGVGSERDQVPSPTDDVVAAVEAIWTERNLTTAGDLGTALTAVLTRRYRTAFSALDDRLRTWEHRFHVEHADQRGTGLKPLIGVVNEAQRLLAAFNDNRALAPNGQWFADADHALDEHADHHLDRMLRRLEGLSSAIRADVELVSMEQMARAAEEAKAASERDADFNTRLSIVTAFLLVPTLIAGIFGANTALPGQGKWWGFVAMVVLMAVTGPAVWWLIRSANSKEPRQDS